MKSNTGKLSLFNLLRSLSLIVLALFGFVTIIASGGSDDGVDSGNTKTYSIQGTITLASDSTALANITVELSGDSTASITTDDDGTYTFEDIEEGDYTVTPSIATGYSFDPESTEVAIDSEDSAGVDFTATPISAAVFLHYYFPDQKTYLENGGTVDDEAAALFSDYTLTDGVTYSDGTGDDPVTVSGYAVEQFIDEDDVFAATPDPDGLLDAGYDVGELYSVVVRSNDDGFSNRSKFYSKAYYNADLRWDQFIGGYLLDLNYSAKVHFPATVTGDLIKMYNTKYAYDIYMFRKIDVKMPDEDGTLVTFEPQATTDNYVNDDTYYTETGGLRTTKFTVETTSFGDYTDVKVISLNQFLTDYVTDAPESYTYKIVSLLDDTYMEGWTYTEMQQAYYLPDLDFIIQVDSDDNVVDDTKLNFPVRIELVTGDGSTVEYDNSAEEPPAYAYAYDEE